MHFVLIAVGDFFNYSQVDFIVNWILEYDDLVNNISQYEILGR